MDERPARLVRARSEVFARVAIGAGVLSREAAPRVGTLLGGEARVPRIVSVRRIRVPLALPNVREALARMSRSRYGSVISLGDSGSRYIVPRQNCSAEW